MIIRNTSVPGLYKYKQYETYEFNDLIYYNGMLYLVIAGTYTGDLTPDESPKCSSFIELLKDDNELVTSSNISRLINEYIKGLQSGGTIARLNIISLDQLNDYIHTGIYSIDTTHILFVTPFEAIFRVYRFEVAGVTKVVQEIINYADTRLLTDQSIVPPNIWYRVGILDDNDVVTTWTNFIPIVSAYDNTDYGSLLNELANKDNTLKSQVIELSQLLSQGAYYYLDETDGSYSLPITHTGVINVIYLYTDDNEVTYQDNFTYDVSNGSGNVITICGNEVIVTVNTSDDNYLISFNVDHILKVIEITQ